MLIDTVAHDSEVARIARLSAVSSALNAFKNAAEDAALAVRNFLTEIEKQQSAPETLPDPTPMRLAAQQLRQVLQALTQSGLDKPGLLLSAMAELLDKVVQEPNSRSEETGTLLASASAALTQYLGAVLQDPSASVLPLFGPYQGLCALLGRAQVHPADLWPMPWRWEKAELPQSQPPLAYDVAVRARMDQAVLEVVKAGSAHSAQTLSDVCQGLANAQTNLEPGVFWQIASAFFEALAHDGLKPDLYVKRTTLRVLRQYTALERGDLAAVESLAHELLFFCAQAASTGSTRMPMLSGVLLAYGLARQPEPDLTESSQTELAQAPVPESEHKDFLADLEFPELASSAQAAAHPEPERHQEPEPTQATSEPETGADDEQIRVIGSLRIGIPEYNLYLNEADEWSRRLQTELSEWSMELHRPLPPSTVALAQAIESGSSKVGFVALSDLAKALAKALTGFAHGALAEPAHARIFVAAADAVRHLLHQFAAGFLKEAEPELIRALDRIAQTVLPAQEDSAPVEQVGAGLQPSLFAQISPPADPKELDSHIAQVEASIEELSGRLQAMRGYLNQLQARSKPPTSP